MVAAIVVPVGFIFGRLPGLGLGYPALAWRNVDGGGVGVCHCGDGDDGVRMYVCMYVCFLCCSFWSWAR